MLKIEKRNLKFEIGFLAACLAFHPCGVADAAPERIGPAFGPVLRIEHGWLDDRPQFERSKTVFWYPRVVKPRRGEKIEHMLDERQAGGLVMKVREDIMPGVKPPGGVWFTLFRPIRGQCHPGWGKVEPSPVCFGSIRPVPMLPGEHFFASERPTWGANKLTYNYMRPVFDGGEEKEHFSVTINRLSPGVMVENGSDMIVFFSDIPKTPRHLAWPDAGQIERHTLNEEEVSALAREFWQNAVNKDMLAAVDYDEIDLAAPEWILVWFGEKGSYFYASRDARWLHEFIFHASTGEGHPVGIEAAIKGKDGEGSTNEADMPFLLVFENPPVSFCAVEGGGIRFTFDGEAGKIVLHPLFGENLPAVGEFKGWNAGLSESTRLWADKLPDAIREKCEWWNKRLRQFPVDVEESAKYDEATDELTLTYRFDYEPVGEGGIKFAPISPMLALATKMGFTARVPDHADPGYYTQVGPYIGVDNADEYEITMSGLGKYARQARIPGSAACPEFEKIKARLTAEIEKILAAGRLAPGLYHSTHLVRYQFRSNPSFLWDRPGEIVRCLAETLDFLPEEVQERAIAYMKDEQAALPAERTIAVSIRDGARREPFRLDTRMPNWSDFTNMSDYRDDIVDFANYLAQHNDRYLREQLVPPDALYALAEYSRRVPGAKIDWKESRNVMDAYDARRDWATLGFIKRIPSRMGLTPWTQVNQGGGRDASSVALANSHLVGCIGMVRLAKALEDKTEIKNAYARFYLAAAHRFALEAYCQWLYADELLRLPGNFKSDSLFWFFSGSWTGWRNFIINFTPENDSRQIRELDEMHVSLTREGNPLIGETVPELGRFFNGFFGDKLRAKSVAAHQSPDWFVWNSGGYSGKKQLGNADYFFHAWIMGASAEELAAWVGASWATVGDLYYIQRLVEALYACRGVEWREWSPAPAPR